MGPDHWLTEGFAEYVAARFVRDRFGEAAFDSLMGAWDLQSRTMGPVWTPDMQGSGPDLLLYRKAPVVLSRLEARIGREAFDDFLLRYMTGDGRTTRELLTELEAAAGAAAVEAFVDDLASGPAETGP
jgi:aminopeptidase N